MSISPRLACLRRTASRAASRRASGCTVRRSWASCSACAERNSTCSICFGTAERATWSRPRSSAVRRRTSSVIILRNAAMRSRISRRSTSSAKLPSSTSGPAQVGQDPGQQRLRGEHAQRLVRRPRGLPGEPADAGARSARAAQRVDDGAGELGQRLGVAVAQQLGEDVAQGVDVDRAVLGVVDAGHVDLAAARAQRGGPVQLEEGVERLALARAAQQRRGKALAQVLAVDEVERAEHPRGVDGLARPDRHAVPPQGAHEGDEVARQAVLDDGHTVSSAAARRRLSRRRTGA